MTDIVGRFAPSPTGPLHMGSLLAALASFLSARSCGGRWLLRMDDLDQARVVPEADRLILDTLLLFGLQWDGAVLYQSTRRAAYDCALTRLIAAHRVFACGCTRKEAQAGPEGLEGPIYPGTCRCGLPSGREARSWRLRVDSAQITVYDGVQHAYTQALATDVGDFVVRRADDVIAYQLATVVDDAHQGVTEVVRGADLLSSTPRQVLIAGFLDYPAVRYAHIPVIVDASGSKLGKSQGALALDHDAVVSQLWHCLMLLGQRPPEALRDGTRDSLLRWGVTHWDLARVPCVPSIGQPLYQRS